MNQNSYCDWSSFDMVDLQHPGISTQCTVHDKHPESEQKRISIVVRPSYKVAKVICDIRTQFGYKYFDLVLQPVLITDELVYLNDRDHDFLFDVPGFQSDRKNHLILLPSGGWDGNTRKRYDLPPSSPKIAPVVNSNRITSNHHNNSSDVPEDFPTLPSTLTTVTNTTTTSMACSLQLTPLTDGDTLSDDDLALGASASPTETEMGVLDMGFMSPNKEQFYYTDRKSLNQLTTTWLDKNIEPSATATPNIYVGLVNQAMTCYLNSLLQALYMTPEFRNALYRWEFDNDSEEKNIPYQLQKLFLKLQTSKKPAVETKDLTRSFGWDSTEAWQQHDIQELCRVMFDALEQRFRNTKQANLIASLYEGQMIDYVKCLECNTEKTRADTFLDIPLPVRPFGSSDAYGSIEEALHAFVQPETLDGNNQYFCEKCDKKCDAHKGLKFKNFPYILTLHLKRFDFDYTTMQRIKLNDKVTFPQKLDLNSFLRDVKVETLANGMATNATTATPTSQPAVNGFLVNGATAANTDDCSTTDSGSAMEEDTCCSIPTTACSSQHENDMQDDDEGIDISSSTDHRTVSSEVEQVSKASESPGGPYIYELFAIMIHSGSASGGHYYAYIKEFENNEWYSFNDQMVSPLTQEDIQKSFGGSSTKAYYSSVFSSSTNAYMLMYRQIDAKRNERAMQVADFPEHIKQLLPRVRSDDVEEFHRRSGDRYLLTELTLPDRSRQRVYFYHPILKKMKVTRVPIERSINEDLVLEAACVILNVEAPASRCRLVAFDGTSEVILQSLEDFGDSSMDEIRTACGGGVDFLLEYRAEGQEFEIYKPGGATWYVYMVNLNTMEMDGPYLVYSAAYEKNDVLKHSIAVRLHVKENELLLATLPKRKAFVAYDPVPTAKAEELLQSVAKNQFRSLTYFYLKVPKTDGDSLKALGIPPLSAPDAQTPTATESASKDIVDAVLLNGGHEEPNTNGCLGGGDFNRRYFSSVASPGAMATESNSEDSSLSDGDRTLVESMHNRGGGDSQLSSTNHSPQLSSPEDEAAVSDAGTSRKMVRMSGKEESLLVLPFGHPAPPLFFHAIKIESGESDATEPTTAEKISYKIIVDSHMKMEAFKRHIANLIRVPEKYFTVARKHDASDPINSTQSLVFLLEGTSLVVQLGKVLEENEYKAKIFFMKLSELEDCTTTLPYVFEWVCRAGMTVGEAKKELVAHLRNINAKYETLSMENCRLWTKGGRNPIKILSSDEVLGSDVHITTACEFIVQECEDGVPTETDEDSFTLFVRQWHPDTLTLGGFQEITLKKEWELRSAIAKISQIPEENISYHKVNSFFPCTNISKLSLMQMLWSSDLVSLEKDPLNTMLNANVFLYKDNTVVEKKLTEREEHVMRVNDNALRLRTLERQEEKSQLDHRENSTSYYKPRRERALKIHLDSSHSITTTPSRALGDTVSCKFK